jgi:hypothetical protein
MKTSDNLISHLIIKGSYFDTFLYRSYLYLLKDNCQISIVDWSKVVLELGAKEHNYLGYNASFLLSNLLYDPNYAILYQDDEIKKDFLRRLSIKQTSSKTLDELISSNIVNLTIEGINESPFDFMIYYDQIFYLTTEGLFCQSINYKKILAHRLSSAYCVSKGTYVSMQIGDSHQILLCGLDKGVTAINFKYENGKEESVATKFSAENVSFIERNFSSYLLGSYYGENNFMIRSFDEKNRKYNIEETKNLSAVFENYRYIISFREKVYAICDDGIYSSVFTQSKKEFSKAVKISNSDYTNKRFVCGKAAYFGIVLEFDDCIEVLLSNDKIYSIPFPKNDLINWRCFPDSTGYTNQLHLVFSDHIDIYSFNQDFLVNQWDKKLGSNFYRGKFDSNKDNELKKLKTKRIIKKE